MRYAVGCIHSVVIFKHFNIIGIPCTLRIRVHTMKCAIRSRQLRFNYIRTSVCRARRTECRTFVFNFIQSV